MPARRSDHDLEDHDLILKIKITHNQVAHQVVSCWLHGAQKNVRSVYKPSLFDVVYIKVLDTVHCVMGLPSWHPYMRLACERSSFLHTRERAVFVCLHGI